MWGTGIGKMEPEYDVNAANVQANSYNSIGNILSNLELIGNNSNFEQNFDIVTSHNVVEQQKNPYQNQPKPNPMLNVDNNLVNPHHHHQQQYFQQQPPSSQQMQYNPSPHLQPNYGSPEFSGQPQVQPQNHTITDISKTNNNLQFVDSFSQSIDYLQQSYQYV